MKTDKLKKKEIILILVFVLILFPLILNYYVSNGLFGLKPINTEFSNKDWFTFWSNYFPAILAFSGTLIAIYVGVRQNRDLMNFEIKNFSFSIMPKLKFKIEKISLHTYDAKNNLKMELDQIKHDYYENKRNLVNLINEFEKVKKDDSDFLKHLSGIRLEIDLTDTSNWIWFERLTLQSFYKSLNSDENKCFREILELYKKNIEVYYQWKNTIEVSQKQDIVISSDDVNIVTLSTSDKVISDEPFINTLRIEMKLENYGVTDIVEYVVKKISVIEIDKVVFDIDKQIDVVINHNNEEDINGRIIDASINLELISTSFKFESNKNYMLVTDFVIKTAAGYMYSGSNYLKIKIDCKGYSYSSLMPML